MPRFPIKAVGNTKKAENGLAGAAKFSPKRIRNMKPNEACYWFNRFHAVRKFVAIRRSWIEIDRVETKLKP